MRIHDDWLLLPQRMVVHEPTGVAVLADLHLGYSEARRRRGDAVPVPTMASILAPLAQAAAAHSLRGLLIAGDLFERGFDADVYRHFVAMLEDLALPFLGLVPGNHDGAVEKHIVGAFLWPNGYLLGGWRVVHGDTPLNSEAIVQGHVHPALRWRGRKHPCFLIGPRQIVLPAYSTNAAGVEVSADQEGRRSAIIGAQLVEVEAEYRSPRRGGKR
jgi:uncharacterized protein